MKKKILHLTLKKEWFDLIASKKKFEEHRETKRYWIRRLVNDFGFYRNYDEIHFKNGYQKNAPFMRIEAGCIHRGYRTFEGKEKEVFVIHLGKILEIKHYKGATIS